MPVSNVNHLQTLTMTVVGADGYSKRVESIIYIRPHYDKVNSILIGCKNDVQLDSGLEELLNAAQQSNYVLRCHIELGFIRTEDEVDKGVPATTEEVHDLEAFVSVYDFDPLHKVTFFELEIILKTGGAHV